MFKKWIQGTHIVKYMPAENITASVALTQNRIHIVVLSHSPAFGGPYCERLIRIVPNETIDAGTYRDSVGCVMDALNVYG